MANGKIKVDFLKTTDAKKEPIDATLLPDVPETESVVRPPTSPLSATIQDEGTAVTRRSIVDFQGAGVTVTDDSANAKTVVTINGSNTLTLAAVGATPNANAASYSSGVLNLQPADATHPGVLTNNAQTITGAKTFSASPLTVLSASAASQSPLVIKTTGVVGSGPLLSTNPEFKLQQFEGGIGAAELQFKHKSDEFTERSIMEVESTGTLAVVNDDALRAHFEAYTHGLQNGHSGAYKPTMRVSAYPYEQYQMGPGAYLAAAGTMTRSGSTVTVNVPAAAYEHGYSVGDPIYMTGAETGFTMSEGTLTVASTPAYNIFTYTDVAATATVNTQPVVFTIEPDVTVGRKTAKTLDIQTDAVANPNNYSARFQPTQVSIPSNVTLDLDGPLNSNGSVGTAGHVLTSQGAGLPATWSAASSGGHTIQEEGTSLTSRSILNFVGAGMTASDDGSSKTLVTLHQAGASQEGVVSTGAQTFGGRKSFPGTPINTDASFTVASIDQLPSFVKDDSNTREFYGTRVKPQFNFGASNANTTVTALEVSSTDTGVTGLDHTIANFAKNDATKFRVKGNGEIQFNGQGGTSGQLLTSGGSGTSPTWTTEISDTSHGSRGGGALHANATTSVAGFMSAVDKARFDTLGTVNLVWKAGATSGNGIVGTFAEVKAFADAQTGIWNLYYDNRDAPCEVPAGQFIDFRGLCLLRAGAPSVGGTMQIDIKDTGSLRNFNTIGTAAKLSIEAITQPGYIIDIDQALLIVREGGTIHNIAGVSLVPAIENRTGNAVTSFLEGGNFVNNEPSVKLYKFTNGASFQISACIINAGGLPAISDNSIEGAAGITWFHIYDASGRMGSQTGFLGTPLTSAIDNSKDLNWSQGDTASRPATSTLVTGQMYFDTDQGRPVFWTGSAWVPAMPGTKGDSAGTPGDATLNTISGRSAIANGDTDVTITNSYIVAGSFVFVQPISHWGSMMGQHYVTSTPGSFTVNLTGTAGGDLYFDWHIL